MIPEISIKAEGWYRLKVRRPDDSVRVDTGWFPNLITNNGLDLMYTTPGGSFSIKFFCNACCVGSGNTAPAVTDSSLETLVATVSHEGTFSSSSFVEAAGAVPAYWKSIGSWRFPTGSATGNLSEIGVGHTATNLFSRALIVDGGGSPTTITVLADEVLDVTYELRSYIDKSQVPFTISISGINYSGYVQPFRIATPPIFTYAWNPGGDQANLYLTAYATHVEPDSVYAGPGAGSSSIGGASIITAYVPGTYYLDVRATWSQSSANFSGNNLFVYDRSFCTYMIWFDDQIPKQNYQTLTLDFRLSWGRY